MRAIALHRAVSTTLLFDQAAGSNGAVDTVGRVVGPSAHEPAPGALEETREALVAPQAAGVAGILSAALLVASLLLVRSGLGGPPTLELMTHGGSKLDTDRIRTGLMLVPWVAITFIWFMAVLRTHFADPSNALFSTVFVVTGTLFLATLLVACALSASLAGLHDQTLSNRLPAFWVGGVSAYELLFLVAPRMAGAFILITTNLLRRVGVMPDWMAVLSVLCGVAMMVVVRRVDWVVFVLPVWVVAVSVLVIVRRARVASADHLDPTI